MKTGIETTKIEAIDGRDCEDAFIRSGRDPDQLARFIKKYPAAAYLSWVQVEINKWIAFQDFDKMKKLQPGRGQSRHVSEITKALTDFLIYKAVVERLARGENLTGDGGACEKLANIKIAGTYYNPRYIHDHYYSWIHVKPARFVDNGETLIVGPTRVTLGGKDAVGFVKYTPNGGIKTL